MAPPDPGSRGLDSDSVNARASHKRPQDIRRARSSVPFTFVFPINAYDLLVVYKTPSSFRLAWGFVQDDPWRIYLIAGSSSYAECIFPNRTRIEKRCAGEDESPWVLKPRQVVITSKRMILCNLLQGDLKKSRLTYVLLADSSRSDSSPAHPLQVLLQTIAYASDHKDPTTEEMNGVKGADGDLCLHTGMPTHRIFSLASKSFMPIHSIELATIVLRELRVFQGCFRVKYTETNRIRRRPRNGRKRLDKVCSAFLLSFIHFGKCTFIGCFASFRASTPPPPVLRAWNAMRSDDPWPEGLGHGGIPARDGIPNHALTIAVTTDVHPQDYDWEQILGSMEFSIQRQRKPGQTLSLGKANSRVLFWKGCKPRKATDALLLDSQFRGIFLTLSTSSQRSLIENVDIVLVDHNRCTKDFYALNGDRRKLASSASERPSLFTGALISGIPFNGTTSSFCRPGTTNVLGSFSLRLSRRSSVDSRIQHSATHLLLFSATPLISLHRKLRTGSGSRRVAWHCFLLYEELGKLTGWLVPLVAEAASLEVRKACFGTMGTSFTALENTVGNLPRKPITSPGSRPPIAHRELDEPFISNALYHAVRTGAHVCEQLEYAIQSPICPEAAEKRALTDRCAVLLILTPTNRRWPSDRLATPLHTYELTDSGPARRSPARPLVPQLITLAWTASKKRDSGAEG
ncbi:hypothetical protein NMY22_g11448 [Coprinellus aureogranulatus]|nr:hypothetical protein NMY22_g11448 [Coprinellus aureogranulatus]